MIWSQRSRSLFLNSLVQLMTRSRILALAIVLLSLAACQPQPDRSIAPPNAIAVPSPPPVAVPAIEPPQVEGDRIFQHVQALNFERYRDRDRARVRDYLVQKLRDYGLKPETQKFETGVNVVAERPGSDPELGAILITAHYDTVPGSPGADDNASSVAAALEMARLLGPRSTLRSLKFAFFDQEEVGLRGSLAYTTVPSNVKNLGGVVNLEMLGYACTTPGCQQFPDGLPIKPPSDRGDFLGVVGDQEHLPLLAAFQGPKNQGLPPIVTLPVPFKGLLTPDLLRSDHAPFWAQNIGAVMVGDTANFRNPHYHQPSDTPDTLDRAFLSGSTQRVVNAVIGLLQRRASLETRRS
jgi:hypothetical protein